jgi:hypothetical protein
MRNLLAVQVAHFLLGQIHLVVEGMERGDLLSVVPLPLGILRMALMQCLLLLLQFLQAAPFPLCGESGSGVDPVLLLLPPTPAMGSLEGVPGLILRPPLLGPLLKADCGRALEPLPLDLPACNQRKCALDPCVGVKLCMHRASTHRKNMSTHFLPCVTRPQEDARVRLQP